MIELIALDLDGTLLGPSHTVSKRNREAILRAEAQGIEVIVATGRGYQEAINPLRAAGLSPAFICLNGADVRDRTGNIVSGTYLFSNQIKQIRKILNKYNLDYQVFSGDYVYTLDPEQQVEIFVQLAEDLGQTPDVDEIRAGVMKSVNEGYVVHIDNFESLFADDSQYIYKIFSASYNRKNLDAAREELKEIEGLAVSSSGAGNLEITNTNAQKGIALTAYAKTKGIDMENVMAVGDNYNDLSMFEAAGRSVAMGSASDDIKAVVTHHTDTNANDGVGQAIEEVLD